MGVVCFLTDLARDTLSSIVTAWLTPSLVLLMTSLFGANGKRELVKKCGPLNQLLSCKTTAHIPLVPAGLSLVATWIHWSTLVYSKFWPTRFETKIGCFSLEFIHKNGRAVCPYEYLVNSYSKCLNNFVLQHSGK